LDAQRLAPLSGIVFVAAFIVGFFVLSSGTTQVTDSAQTITSYYANHHQKAELVVGIIAVGLVFLAIFVAGGVHVALADGGTHGFGPDSMVALNGLDNNILISFVFALGLMLLGVAGATIKTAALPKWLGWAALVLGILCFTPVWFLGAALGLIWIVIASITLSQKVATTA
jgi:hypothetical protein